MEGGGRSCAPGSNLFAKGKTSLMRAMGAPASAGVRRAVRCVIHCGLKELGQKF